MFSVNIHAYVEVDADTKDEAIACALEHLEADAREHIHDISVSIPTNKKAKAKR